MMTFDNQEVASGDLDALLNEHFAGKIVRKDLTKLVLITRNNFDKLTEEQPTLGVKILKKIARLMSLRLRQTTGVLVDHLQ